MAGEISKAILISGCSTGIGRATATQLARDGWTVYASARRLETIADLSALGCRTLALDVCDEASIRTAVETVEREHGAVGVLINNAGYGLEGAFEETQMSEIRRQFETNVFGLIRLTQLVLPAMRRQRWGRIVNLSSMGGEFSLRSARLRYRRGRDSARGDQDPIRRYGNGADCRSDHSWLAIRSVQRRCD
jgi:NAD(P)-dependent dehydrogenase (short-subunit alcohol dehydrogenase family)